MILEVDVWVKYVLIYNQKKRKVGIELVKYEKRIQFGRKKED